MFDFYAYYMRKDKSSQHTHSFEERDFGFQVGWVESRNPAKQELGFALTIAGKVPSHLGIWELHSKEESLLSDGLDP